MIEKIISGGQTGVDRAALDAALKYGIPVGGWCPKGRIAEDGIILERYPLRETESGDYSERTSRNVRDSEATLIILPDKVKSPGTLLTIDEARRMTNPFLVLDPGRDDPVRIFQWLHENGIKTLNVAGPRESESPGIYQRSFEVFDALFLKLVSA